MKDWYKEAVELGEKIGVQPQLPRITARQRHRPNSIPTDLDTESYFRVNLAVPFLDHLNEQFNTRFSKENRVGSKLLKVSPKVITSFPRSSMTEIAEDMSFWLEDLPYGNSILVGELKMWWDKWHAKEEQPESLKESLAACDKDIYPCINTLLTLACTVPVTSCEAERSFSALRRTVTVLRSTMGEDRLSDLTLMHLHNNVNINPVDKFIVKHKRRLFTQHSILFE